MFRKAAQFIPQEVCQGAAAVATSHRMLPTVNSVLLSSPGVICLVFSVPVDVTDSSSFSQSKKYIYIYLAFLPSVEVRGVRGRNIYIYLAFLTQCPVKEDLVFHSDSYYLRGTPNRTRIGMLSSQNKTNPPKQLKIPCVCLKLNRTK